MTGVTAEENTLRRNRDKLSPRGRVDSNQRNHCASLLADVDVAIVLKFLEQITLLSDSFPIYVIGNQLG